jgi:hypothetical protein
MATSKQKRVNAIEYWLRLGTLGSLNERSLHPTRKLVRKCICGLSYTKYNWVLRRHIIIGTTLIALLAASSLIDRPDWFVLGLIFGVWLGLVLTFRVLGHSLKCALRRPFLILADLMGSGGRG